MAAAPSIQVPIRKSRSAPSESLGSSRGPGSVSALDDLSDVTINSPTAGQFFEYASDGQWKNVSEIAGGTY